MFMDGARMVVDFAVETLGVRRLEARAAVANGRGNGALRKLGAQFRKACSAGHSSRTACISIRCCGRSSRRNGVRQRLCGETGSFTSPAFAELRAVGAPRTYLCSSVKLALPD